MNYVITDYRILDIEKENLLKLGYEVLLCPKCSSLYKAVDGHPDMLMHFVDSCRVVVHNKMNEEFINAIDTLGFTVYISKTSLTNKYPQDIILNAVSFSDYFIHYTKFTDETLKKLVMNKLMIEVKQGYTKCSTAVVSGKAIITNDTGIAKSLKLHNFDVLLLPPGDILLPGLNYGFIGGCCGLLEENLLAFYGSLDHYAYGAEVKDFLKKHRVEPVYLRDGKLIDRGSIFSLTHIIL